MAQARVIVVYDPSELVIQALYQDWKLGPDDARLRVPFYAQDNRILFNGAFSRIELAIELANEVGADMEVYLLGPAPGQPDPKPPSWADEVKGQLRIRLVPLPPPPTPVPAEPEEAEESEAEESESEESEAEEEQAPKKRGRITKGKAKAWTEKQAQDILGWFDVNITGTRDGDIIVGVRDKTAKTLIKVHGDPIRPKGKELGALRQHPTVWRQFLAKLAGVPFFAPMSPDQRAKWISDNEAPGEGFIGDDSENFWVELLQPGDGALVADDVDPGELERLMEGNPDHPQGWWRPSDIAAIIPAKPGSRGLRGQHTLFWLKGWWKLASDYKTVPSFSGLVFDVQNGEALSGASAGALKLVVVDDITASWSKPSGRKKREAPGAGPGEAKARRQWVTGKTQSVGFLVDPDMPPLTWPNISKIVLELIAEFQATKGIEPTLERIKANFKEYTPASHKSLLQKLIRFRARRVALMPGLPVVAGADPTLLMSFDAILVDTRLALLMTMAALAISPGSFVPDIQRYVTGLESLSKRLGVSIVEDASIDDPRKIQSLWSGALLAQRVRTWRPNSRLLKAWMRYGLEAWSRREKYVFDNDIGLKTAPFTLSASNTPFQNCSALIDELRSFEGDLGMTRYIAGHYTQATALWAKPIEIQDIDVMPIYHHIDQHSATQIAWFVDPELAESIAAESDEPTSVPYSSLFYRVFSEDTGFNPRPPGHMGRTRKQRTLEWNPADPFVAAISEAQQLTLQAKQLDQIKRPVLKGAPYQLQYELDTSWLAGLVGAIEIKGTPAVIVTLGAKDPLLLVAVRRPARQMKEEGLSPQREEAAKEAARAQLRKGLTLKAARAPHPFLDHATVFLKTDKEGQDYFMIRSRAGEERSWDQARQVKLELPYHERLTTEETPREDRMRRALLKTGDGLEEGAWHRLDELWDRTDNSVVRRALYYIGGYKASFEINPVGRGGGGTKGAVMVEDTAAYQFLLELSLLFPGALRPVQYQPGKFESPVGPLLWMVRDILRGKLAEGGEEADWGDLKIWDRKERTPWEHQISSLEEMIDNHERGMRGAFLYLSVGLGKTLVVLSFIKYLHEHGELPRFILYSLPASALKSVAEEILAFGLPVNLLIPTKGKKKVAVPPEVKITYGCDPEPAMVNLIEHDHLRRCQEELAIIADESLIIFRRSPSYDA